MWILPFPSIPCGQCPLCPPVSPGSGLARGGLGSSGAAERLLFIRKGKTNKQTNQSAHKPQPSRPSSPQIGSV